MNQVKTIKILEKIMKMHRIKKKKFNMHKMFKISAETVAKNLVYNIIDKKKSCG